MFFALKKFRRQLNKRLYRPLNRIELSAENLLNNYQYLLSVKPGVSVAPVLKSNAYGHGLVEIATILDKKTPPFFCVDSLFEAYELKKADIKSPILITGYIDPFNVKIKTIPFSYAVFDIDFAKALNSHQPGTRIHLFIDTGMGREGITLADLPQFLTEIKQLSRLNIEGVMSHFASADEKNSSQTIKQLENFNKAVQMIKEVGLDPKWIHLSASAGLIGNSLGNCNLSRVGLSIYGYNPFNLVDNNFKPVLRLTTKIVQLKRLPKGSPIGYNHTYFLEKDSTIAILPLGYFDGVDRHLSQKGVVKVGGEYCPIIGSVSMNITTIDVSSIKDPVVGQEVEIISRDPKALNSIGNIAKTVETMPYEIMVHLASTTRRDIL